MIPSEIRRELPARLKRLNISASLLSELSGVDVAQISRFFANKATLSLDKALLLLRRVELCERLANLLRPFPIDFRNVPRILALEQWLDSGLLQVAIINRVPEPEVPGQIVLSGQEPETIIPIQEISALAGK